MTITDIVSNLFNASLIHNKYCELKNLSSKKEFLLEQRETTAKIIVQLKKLQKELKIITKTKNMIDLENQATIVISEYSMVHKFIFIFNYYFIDQYEYDYDSLLVDLPVIIGLITNYLNSIETLLFPILILDKYKSEHGEKQSKISISAGRGELKIIVEKMRQTILKEAKQGRTLSSTHKERIKKYLQNNYPYLKYESVIRTLNKFGYSKERIRSY